LINIKVKKCNLGMMLNCTIANKIKYINDLKHTQGDSMKALLLAILAASSMLVATQASAVDATAAQALAQKSGCLACHSIDKKVLGPAYKDVAAKYKGDKSAEAKLVEKVKKGGSGVWGPMPMPANSPQVKDEDIKTMVKWILSL
jgi:cytochrome c